MEATRSTQTSAARSHPRPHPVARLLRNGKMFIPPWDALTCQPIAWALISAQRSVTEGWQGTKLGNLLMPLASLLSGVGMLVVVLMVKGQRKAHDVNGATAGIR